MRRLVSLLVLALLLLPSLGSSLAHAQAQKGPAIDKVTWLAIDLKDVANALENGQIDVYLFGLRPSAAQQLAGKPDIKLYQAPSGLVDIGLNPAPVMIVQLPGKYDKAAAAKELGIDPVAIEYATYIPKDANLSEINSQPFIGVPINKTDVTIVELCAKPLNKLPAEAKTIWESNKLDINPFCFRQIRFALNYIVNRDFIVKNIYKGFAIPKYACYGPDDPMYVDLIDVVAKYNFNYNPQLAKRMVTEVMTKIGAKNQGGIWYYNGKPVKVIGIIRQEDERFDIGNLFSDQLEKVLGIKVDRQTLPFTEAIPKVYFTDPKDFKWSFYTEGWGRGALDRWDPWMLAQFGAAWLGWAPGWGETSYWNYRNATIDKYSKAAALGEVKSKQEFIEDIRKGLDLSIKESVRIWIAATESSFAARADVKGVTLDLGAGLRNPFFYRGMYKPGSNEIKVGHLHVFTAGTVWNPYGGFSDVYSVDPARATYDPFIWRHPFNGEPIAFRVTYTVETAGPNGKMQVPDDAIWWDPVNDKWVYAKDLGRTTAVSKVVFDLSKLAGTKWHDGQAITCADVLALWATWLDLTYDQNKASLESSIAGPQKETFDKIVAIRPLPKEHKLEVYLNYWHFDPNYIADFATLTPQVPAEIMFAMDYLAFHAKTYALSDTRSKSSGIPQLNLVLESHAKDVVAALKKIDFDAMYKSYITLPNGMVPVPGDADAWWQARVQAVEQWFNEYHHVWISDGPFKLVEYNKDKDMLRLEAFRDPSYPFGPTDWVFGLPTPTQITGVNAPIVAPGKPATITVSVSGLPPLHVKYMLRDPVTGQIVGVGEAEQGPTGFVIQLPAELTSKLQEFSAYQLVVIAYSDQVALPAQKTVVLQTTARAAETEQQVQQLQRQLQQTQQQVQALQQQLQQQAQQLQQLAQQLSNLQQALGEQLAQQLQQLTTGITQTVQTLGKQITQVGNAVTQVGTRIDQLNQQVSSIDKKLDTLQAQVSGLNGIQKTIKDTKAAAEDAYKNAEAAAGKANLAVIIGVINLILLLIALALLFKKQQ
jgi:peptide/nickel transport system substrate-binding protein